MLEDPGQPSRRLNVQSAAIWRDSGQAHPMSSRQRKPLIGNRKAPLEIIVLVFAGLWAGEDLQGRVNHCPLVEGVALVPFPDKHLSGNSDLWSGESHSRSSAHGIEHVCNQEVKFLSEFLDR